MASELEERDEAFERWLSDYRERADTIAAALGELFQKAMKLWSFDESGKSLQISKSCEFLKAERIEFLHRILFFIYSSRSDEAVESQILDSEESRAELPEDLTPEEILTRKAARLEPNFRDLIKEMKR